MTVWMDRLIRPESYVELQVQKAIEHYWPCLFRHYSICSEYKNTVMPRTWAPDIIAVETASEHGSILIVELKGFPPSSSLDATVHQVVGYGKQYHQKHPCECVRLAVIGPWKFPRATEMDGYEVTILSLHDIGKRLSELADELLLWMAQLPTRGTMLLDVESSVFKTPAVTALVPDPTQ
jgi:hypothetical protein